MKEIAIRFQAVVREVDTVPRIGGDEFVILLELDSDNTGLSRVAKEILASLENDIIYKEHQCNVGASIGIAMYPENGETLDELFKAADEAMYKVKNTGKNSFAFAGK